ncbi:uncharacterized protein LOC112084866 [Eutrema salsugineum]|uniref:uncharacterized protein LOC112084866 n=1 Tax=Eutrema salsugineum TaxID=72664 RepID=UPI000CED15AA|nr:uncharacterized protein LOC112084866 [Eutrema salsugineum]
MAAPVNNGELIARLNESLRVAYAAEENFWKQRSRNLWLSLGDRNTGFFHATAKSRATANNFAVIEDVNGVPKFEEDQMVEVVVSYFQKIFTAEHSTRLPIVEEAISPSVSTEINEQLIVIPSPEEIKRAVFSIHADKAPGPDGFSASFFHSNWDTVGPEIVTEIQEFFSSGVLPPSCNETFIRLIPKCSGPKKMSEYRPIALCNVYYKIISKILTKRLQPLLPDLISENQSAFVAGRAISDNVLTTHEMLHFLKTSEAKVYCSMAVKTDMSKAYDRLDWNFIRAVLVRFGFHHRWVEWVMQSKFFPLCSNAQANGSLQGFRAARGSPRLNHLLFADDTMFFCNTSESNTLTLLDILQKYESASRQAINREKSSISFSRKTPPLIKDRVQRTLQIFKEGGIGKYLGLPEHFGRRKKDLFTGIVDKIRQKSLSWSSRFLSSAGKMVLLKSVLSAIPNYAMSCFKLPGSLCHRIQSALTRFWWDDKRGKKKMCWIAWSKLTRGKGQGGLGFRDISCFNDALLAKQGWRILTKPDCLLARILLGKYCNGSNFLDCVCPASASHGWRSLLIGRDLLRDHLGWSIGNGKSVNVWSEAWLSSSSQLSPGGPAPKDSLNLMVSDLLNPTTNSWNTQKVQAHIPLVKDLVVQIKPSLHNADDVRIWLRDKSGVYTTKSGYYVALEKSTHYVDEHPLDWTSAIWNISTTPKIKTFLWKAMSGALPVGVALAKRIPSINLECTRCHAPETPEHLLFLCPFAQEVWTHAPFKSAPWTLDDEGIAAKWNEATKASCLDSTDINKGSLAPWICWNLWKARNKLIFSEITFSVEEVVQKAILNVKEWHKETPDKTKVAKLMVLESTPDRLTETICHTDAAWREDVSMAGLGWTLSPQNDPRTRPFSQVELSVSSPLVAEGLALRAALRHALGENIISISVLSDSQSLIRAISSGSSISEIYSICEDIKILSACFDHITFKCIPRSLNLAADAAAKSTLYEYSVSD